MLQYQYVEDYIEALAGYDSASPSPIATVKYSFSLARYDVQIVENMANSTMWDNTAMTDKQGDLAIKLVLKYKRQFINQGIDISPVETAPTFRIPLRKVDRERRIWIEDDELLIKFPYDQKLIDEVRGITDSGQGKVQWDYPRKIWRCGITEFNINWAVSWATVNKFNIDLEVADLFEKILTTENQPYEIKLVRTDTGFEIINAAESLSNYVAEHIGDDLIKLIDFSGILGYTIDDDLLVESNQKYGQALEYFGTKHNIHLDPVAELAEWLFDYAELTNRYPICIYDPSPLPAEQSLLNLKRFNESEIVRFDQNGKTNTSEYDPYNVKVVYAKKLPKTWEFPIPLLVSTRELMWGGRKLDWINRAEKIVYFCHKIREH